MKNIVKFTTLILSLSVFVFISCEDEDSIKMPDLTKGAVPYVIKAEGTDQIIDFFNKESFSSTLQLSIGEDEGADFVNSVILVGAYNGGTPIEFSTTISSLPAELTIAMDDILNKFGLVIDDLVIGDQIAFGVDLYMNDGRVLKAFSETGNFGYSPSLRSTPRNSVFGIFNVTCVSAIPVSGTWTADCTTDIGISSTNDNVTIEALGNGQYKFSDVTGGFYSAVGPFNVNQPAVVTDICNSLTITSSDAQFSIVADSENVGEWDPTTETFVIYWFDDLNEIKGVTTITRN